MHAHVSAKRRKHHEQLYRKRRIEAVELCSIFRFTSPVFLQKLNRRSITAFCPFVALQTGRDEVENDAIEELVISAGITSVLPTFLQSCVINSFALLLSSSLVKSCNLPLDSKTLIAENK